VLVAPGDLEETSLAATLRDGWGIGAVTLTYLAVGWGSHHWDVRDDAGRRWFVTVDELENKRVSDTESLTDGLGRLRASLRTAVALQRAGLDFVVAPVPSGRPAGAPGRERPDAGGEPALRFGGRFAVAVYPFTEGQSFGWDAWTPALRSGVLDLVAAVHQAPRAAWREAAAEDFSVPFLGQVEAVLGGRQPAQAGPYTQPVVRLLREHTAAVRRRLERYRGLVTAASRQPGQYVLTHGEPHPGNAMLTSEGWRLIDWDTVLVAPPERDLWDLDPGDGSVLDGYTTATGVTPRAGLMELYRLKWDIQDLAYDAARFLRPHSGNAEDAEAWLLLRSLVAGADG
jgi:spectinomycin phosphotransferase/16S rRNA (guanine(1405)-N(7))-methyltransferase